MHNAAQNTWWRHQMETFSALLAICAGNSLVPANSPHKGQWRGTLMFSLICVWINGWVNNHEAGDLRRYRGHYDVSVMCHFSAGDCGDRYVILMSYQNTIISSVDIRWESYLHTWNCDTDEKYFFWAWNTSRRRFDVKMTLFLRCVFPGKQLLNYVFFHCRENKREYVKTTSGKWHNLCVFNKTSMASLDRYCIIYDPDKYLCYWPAISAIVLWWLTLSGLVTTSIQTTTCSTFGTNPLSDPMLNYIHLVTRSIFNWNSIWNSKVFIHENAFDCVVCKMSAILLVFLNC